MKAFILDRYGSKVALRACEIAAPEMRDDDVLVEVHAAGVNLLDSKIRNGEFKQILPYGAPFILGHDVAGVVVRCRRARDARLRFSWRSTWAPRSRPPPARRMSTWFAALVRTSSSTTRERISKPG